ncbi:MAG TPA: FAD-binding oxidoreductase [Usitatibacter sp.]|nr:FAD-binding oxidoreductase [Usitatibacter sp.]
MLLKKELGVIENSYYEATVKRPPPEPSLADSISADVGVVGGGYAGLSAALELAKRGYGVALLEAKRIGWGASGRNGGQVLVGMGEDGEGAIEKQFSKEDARRAWNVSVEGIDLLHRRIREHAIECEYRPGYLVINVKPRRWPALMRWAEHVTHFYGWPLEIIPPAHLREWVASERFHAAVLDRGSGHLHPLKYCLGLGRAAKEAGVRIFEHSPVLYMERGERPVLKTGEGEVTCRYVLLAGNVYLDEFGDGIAEELWPRIMPVGTYIIATAPMEEARADALMKERPCASDTNNVLDYFRVSADNRLLFGAGETYTARTPRNLVARMRRRMLAAFPQLADLEITHSWGGFVDMSLNQAPDFGRLAPNLYDLQGFSGHGLALAGMAGKLAAEAIAGQAERFDLFARIRHGHFPGGEWTRAPALALGMMYYRMMDWL